MCEPGWSEAQSGIELKNKAPDFAGASSGLRLLRRSQHGALHRLRQRDRAEKTLRIKIVIAGFIDDPKQAKLLRRGIAQRDIDFPLLQRGRMAVVADAHDELL